MLRALSRRLYVIQEAREPRPCQAKLTIERRRDLGVVGIIDDSACRKLLPHDAGDMASEVGDGGWRASCRRPWLHALSEGFGGREPHGLTVGGSAKWLSVSRAWWLP
jgi:hypothetical protein